MKKLILSAITGAALIAGTFNVTNDGFSKTTGNTVSQDAKSTDNLLTTQVVFKPFKFKVYHTDENNTLSDYLGVVLVSVVDRDANWCNVMNNFSPYKFVINTLKGTYECEIPNTYRKVVFADQSVREVGVTPKYAIPIGVKKALFKIRYLWDPKKDAPFDWQSIDKCKDSIKNNGDITNECAKEVIDRLKDSDSVVSKLPGVNSDNCEDVCHYSDITKAHEIADTACAVCLFKKWGHVAYSKDDFAVRPDKFEINLNVNYPKLRAGQPYIIGIRALAYPISQDCNMSQQLWNLFYPNGVSDYSRIPVWNYHEALTIRGHSPSLEYNDSNESKGCITGNLMVNPGHQITLHFHHGHAGAMLLYDEVGDLNMTVKEFKDGYEFAKIDENDSINPNGLLINPGNNIITFVPFKFNFSDINMTDGGNNFTYISRNLNMSATLEFNLTAVNLQGRVTKNYNAQCYAKNVDLNITHAPVPIASNMIYSLNNGPIQQRNSQAPIDVVIPKAHFSGGSAVENLKINYFKNYKTPNEPFYLQLLYGLAYDMDIRHYLDSNSTFRDTNIFSWTSWLNNITRNLPTSMVIGIKPLINKNAYFVYGRVNIPNVTGYSSVIRNSAVFEYYKNGNWIVNKNHTNSKYGDINLSNSYIPYVTATFDNGINAGYHEIKYQANKALPLSVIGHYAINTWLWYKSNASNYQNPSATNIDCKTHPCNKIDFLAVNGGWAGIGDNSSSYAPDKNRTVQITNKTESNTSKASTRTINW
ncbi:DUF6701 domain-containing protein [Caminibacter pacificus]